MPNQQLTDALKEAYSLAPTDEVLLHTLELHHENFLDDAGKRTALRVVRNFEDIQATLEATAPLNSGEEVTFKAYPFDFRLPPVHDRSLPRAQITIDNVDRLLVEHIEIAIAANKPVSVIYRPYVSSDLSQPQFDPVLKMSLNNVSCSNESIRGDLHFKELSNKSFPAERYTYDRFPTLIR